LSRQPSTRGSSAAPAGRGAATAARRPGGVLVQAPKSDIFVVLLGVSLGAIVLACLLMLLMLNRYGWSVKVSARSMNPHQVAVSV
jgi:hypothetical protein